MEDYLKKDKSKLSNDKTRSKDKDNVQVESKTKYNYPILEYKEKFQNSFSEMKGALSNVSANITNYKNEIHLMEDLLLKINRHEHNHQILEKKFNQLKKYLEETINIENLISKLSSNQQIINISEYVNLHNKVVEIIKYFNNSDLKQKDDYVIHTKRMMITGFKVYEETFYTILRRYDQLDEKAPENEKLNLLNKIRSLAECMNNKLFSFNFTLKMVNDRSEKILQKFENIKVKISKLSKNTDENYEVNSGLVTNLLIESEKLFMIEKQYISNILSNCESTFIDSIYSEIIEQPLNKIVFALKDLVDARQSKKANKITGDFFHNFDVLNAWHNKLQKAYLSVVKGYNENEYNQIQQLIQDVEKYCYDFILNYLDEIATSKEKPENENIMQLCNRTIFILSKIIQFENSYRAMIIIFKKNGRDFSVGDMIDALLERLEYKSTYLDRKYKPLTKIFLINNVFYIHSKISQKAFLDKKFVDEEYCAELNMKIRGYIEQYLKLAWGEVVEDTFNDKENGTLLTGSGTDAKNLKSSVRDAIKRKFQKFNETMKNNQNMQRHIKIIDSNLEKSIIQDNIDYIAPRYQLFYEKFHNTAFTQYKEKYLIYNNSNDVIQELRLYFSDALILK